MAKKRAHHEGSIYRRKDGKWRAQVSLDGKRLSHTAASQRECQTWIKEIRGQIDNGLTAKGSEETLETFLSNWLVTVSTSRAKSTYDHYRWIVEHRVNPHIGLYRMRDLKPDRIQRFYEHLTSLGLSNHAVHLTHKIIQVAFNHAVKMGVLGRNPCKGTTPPKPKQREMKFLDEDQVKILLETAKAMGTKQYALFYLALHTGLRQAELMGLKWEDVNWERRTIQVKRQVLYRRGEGFRFAKPKTSSGIRTITLGEKAMEILQQQQQLLRYLRDAAGEAWTSLDLVFPSEVGTPLTGSNIRRDFRQLLMLSGLPKIRFHDLRHTAASLMLNHGIPVLVASRRLGHSKASITLDVYGHLMPNKQEEAAQLLDGLMETT